MMVFLSYRLLHEHCFLRVAECEAIAFLSLSELYEY
jgi:hypothetical protein